MLFGLSRGFAKDQVLPDITHGIDESVCIGIAMEWRRGQPQSFSASWNSRIVDRLNVNAVPVQQRL